MYVALTPVRLLDTATGNGGTSAPVAARSSVTFPVAGRGGVPADGAGSVVLNIAVASAASNGFATVYPSGTSRPTTSNLNFYAGHTVANLVVARLGSDGAVTIYNGSAGSVRFVADVSGYYVSGTPSDAGAYRPVGPARVLDTASGLGASAASAGARHTASVTVAGRGGVPATGVSAVILNVTVASPSARGYLTVFPYGAARPGTSSLNFAAHRTAPNLVMVRLGASGKVSLYNGSSGSARLVADVFGYFTSGTPSWKGAFKTLTPERVMDTRTGAGSPFGADYGYVPGHGTVRLWVGGRSDIPDNGGAAVVLNVTVTGANGGGYITVYPDGAARPATSSVNFTTGQTVANLVVVRPSEQGFVRFYNSSTRHIQLIADASGYTLTQPAMTFKTARGVGEAADVRDLTCGGPTMCLAMGSSGTVSRLSGSTWGAPVALFASGVQDMSCASPTFCVAISEDGLAKRFNGSTWATIASPGRSVWDISCTSTTFCLAGGTDGRSHRFNGTSWSMQNVSSDWLSEIDCVSSTFCVAMSYDQSAVSHAHRWNGSVWSGNTTLGTGYTQTLSCANTSYCSWLDAGGARWVYGGTDWSDQGGSELYDSTDMSCISSGMCVATGSSPLGRALVTNVVPGPGPVDLEDTVSVSGVQCFTTSSCRVLTSDGYSRTWNGSVWSAPQPVDVAVGPVQDVACVSPTFCAAVTALGWAYTYNGSTWSAGTNLGHRTGLVAVSCVATTFCAAVGQHQVWTLNGTSWSAAATIDPGSRLVDLDCASAASCTAVDAAGQAVTYDGSAWSAPTAFDTPDHGVMSVSCPSSNRCVVAEGAGFVVQLDAGVWGAPVQVSPDAQSLLASCATDDSCVAVSGTGQFVTYDGASWSAPGAVAAGAVLRAVSCVSATFCVAGSESDHAWTWNGETWGGALVVDNPIDRTVSCPTTIFCMGLSSSGGIYIGHLA